MEILPADIEGFKLFRKNQVSGSTVNLPSQADVQPSHRLGTLSRSESREERSVAFGSRQQCSKACIEAAYLSGRKSALYDRRSCELLCVHDRQTAES
jgi:hypothetical protein